MTQPLQLMICGLVVGLIAVAYAEYVQWRQTIGVNLRVIERVRNFPILFMLIVGSMGVVNYLAEPRFVPMNRLDRLWATLMVAVAPLALWSLFDIPLRLARRYARLKRSQMPDHHPLDGVWAPESSWLDKIVRPQGTGPGSAPAPGSHRLPPLERVARLQAVLPHDRADASPAQPDEL